MSERKGPASGEFLDARTFGELVDLSRESIYRAIERGDLQAVRIGRAIRLPRSQLDRLAASGRRDRRSSTLRCLARAAASDVVEGPEDIR